MRIDLNAEIKRILHAAIEDAFAGDSGLGGGISKKPLGEREGDVVGVLVDQLEGAKKEGAIEDDSPLGSILGQLINLKGLIK